MNLRDQREMNQGFGDGLSMAVEFVATPAVFYLLGWLVDRGFDTTPVFAIAFAVFGVIGKFASTWYRYDAKMRREEERLRSEGGYLAVGRPHPRADKP